MMNIRKIGRTPALALALAFAIPGGVSGLLAVVPSAQAQTPQRVDTVILNELSQPIDLYIMRPGAKPTPLKKVPSGAPLNQKGIVGWEFIFAYNGRPLGRYRVVDAQLQGVLVNKRAEVSGRVITARQKQTTQQQRPNRQPDLRDLLPPSNNGNIGGASGGSSGGIPDFDPPNSGGGTVGGNGIPDFPPRQDTGQYAGRNPGPNSGRAPGLPNPLSPQPPVTAGGTDLDLLDLLPRDNRPITQQGGNITTTAGTRFGPARSVGGYVRAQPSKRGQILFDLNEGDAIQILARTNEMLDGLPWFQVGIGPTFSEIGYQWGGIICADGAQQIPGTWDLCSRFGF